MARARQTPQHLEITYAKGCLLYSLDLGYLCDDDAAADAFVAQRVEDAWLTDVFNKLENCEQFGFAQPAFVKSAYGHTDRAPRNTFARRHAKRLVPLQARIINPVVHTEKGLRYFSEGVSVSPQGALSLRIAFAQYADSMTVPELIDLCNQLLRRSPGLLTETIDSFVRLWNACLTKPTLRAPTKDLLEEVLYSYEILDLDFQLRSGEQVNPVTSIKKLYTQADKVPVCELAAISRMSPASAAALRDTRTSEFVISDLGGRDDEMWTVSRERMVRRHPDRKVAYNVAFFEDVHTATEILVAQQAVIDFLEDWIGKQRTSVLARLLSPAILNSAARNSLQERVTDVTKVAYLLIEPIMLQRNVRHSFYAQVISKLTECLELRESNERAARAVRNFSELAQSASSFNLGGLSAELAGTQVELSNSTRRIALATVWITIVATLIATLQAYITFRPQNPNPSEACAIQQSQ